MSIRSRIYSLDKGGTNLDGGPVYFRIAAEVHTAVNSLTESSQSLRLVGFQMTELGKGLFGRMGFDGGTGVGTLGAALGGRGVAMVVDVITGGGGSFNALGGHTLTSSQKESLSRSTNGTDSMSYRTLFAVIFTVLCFCSLKERRCALLFVLLFPSSSSTMTPGFPPLLLNGSSLLFPMLSPCELFSSSLVRLDTAEDCE
mmetsp:Transcript_10235/g.29224  ORF Transcript_10235/g.29224 Transcript_10235/m.29224 type:complete len:200 (-) Transcript_10235:194-793(-)